MLFLSEMLGMFFVVFWKFSGRLLVKVIVGVLVSWLDSCVMKLEW